jgi:F-type H+-transporting ATPase subunit b
LTIDAHVVDMALQDLAGTELFALTEAGEAGEGEAAAEETVNPVLPTLNDMVYATIFFVALWAAMKYVLLPPMQKVRAERARQVAAARDAADAASADIGTARADHDAALAGARAEASAIIDAARAEADAHRAEVVGAAEAEAAAMRAEAEAELATARTNAMAALTEDVVGIATGAASTVVGRSVDTDTARSIVERAMSGGSR